jgi:hypothetical protein
MLKYLLAHESLSLIKILHHYLPIIAINIPGYY